MLPAQQQQQSITHRSLGEVDDSVTLWSLGSLLDDGPWGVSVTGVDCDKSTAVDRDVSGRLRCVRAPVAAAADDDEPGWSASKPRSGSFSSEGCEWATVDAAGVVDG